MRLFDLSKRKALITGGSRGPGRAMAEGFMEAGAQIAIVSSTDSTFAAAEELEDMFGAVVVAIRADLSNRDRLHRAFDGCLAELGSLDIQLVNHSIQRR
jgi:2-deoxy-D-gluconate 3-dehydrogenase